MKWFLIGVAILQFVFMMFELFPWQVPVRLKIRNKNRPAGEPFTAAQEKPGFSHCAQDRGLCRNSCRRRLRAGFAGAGGQETRPGCRPWLR